MIDLYDRTMPKGRKLTQFLEEAGLAYQITSVNINKGEQFEPGFSKFAPNIVPHEGQGQDLSQFPALTLWLEKVKNRPATQRAYDVAMAFNTALTVNESAKAILFGQDAQIVG